MREFPASGHMVRENWIDPDTRALQVGIPARGKMARPGDSRSKGLKVVCQSCNNGWMSRLQSAAKPYLEPLLVADFVALHRNAQMALAAWAAMFTMVWEFADPPTACITPAERMLFKEAQLTPPNWFIWIAPFSGVIRDGASWHRGFGQELRQPWGTAVSYHDRPQLTILAAGRLLMVTVSLGSSAPDKFAQPLRRIAAQHGLQRIAPTVEVTRNRRLRADRSLHDQDFPRLMSAFSEAIVLCIGTP